MLTERLAGGDYERLMLYYNPESSQAGGLEADEALLRQVHLGNRVLGFDKQKTLANPGANAEMLGKTLRDGDIVVIRGGDGTANHVLNGLTGTHHVLILPRGNANDLAHQLYSPKDFHDPERLMELGNVRELRPLDITLTREDKQLQTKAWAYVSFGKTAAAAQVYNTADYRKSPWHKSSTGTQIREVLTAAGVYLSPSHFTVQDTPDGPKQRRIERIIANGSLMAKYFHLSADLFKPEAYMIDVHDEVSGLATMAALLQGKPAGQPFYDKQEFTIDAGKPPNWVQIDGETYPFGSPLQVSVEPGNVIVPVFTSV